MRVTLPKVMIAIAVIAVVVRVYVHNVVEPERRFRREWAAWRDAMAARTAAKAERLSQKAALAQQRVAESTRKAQQHPEQYQFWQSEAIFWSRQAARDAGLVTNLKQESQLWSEAQ